MPELSENFHLLAREELGRSAVIEMANDRSQYCFGAMRWGQQELMTVNDLDQICEKLSFISLKRHPTAVLTLTTAISR